MTPAEKKQAIAERRLKVVELRRAGLPFIDIARQVGLSHANLAKNDYDAYMMIQARETLEEARALELDRLDRMQRALWPQVSKGDPKAVTAAIGVQNQRMKLLGLEEASIKGDVNKALGEAGCQAVLAVVGRLVEDEEMQMTSAQKTLAKSIAARHIQSVASGKR